MTSSTSPSKRLQEILSNHYHECYRCGRKYNSLDELLSSNNGCPRKCYYPDAKGQWNVPCKVCDSRNNCHNTHCKNCGVKLQ